MKRIRLFLLAQFLLVMAMSSVQAQIIRSAWSISEAAKGNQNTEDYSILNDFRVNRPITISALGVFDSDGDGIVGSATITVQLYQKQYRDDKPRLLLETLTFKAEDSGQLRGAFRCKNLSRPVTLLPGVYTITASGFDKKNKKYDFSRPASEGSTQPVMSLDDGGGAITFLGMNKYYGENLNGDYELAHHYNTNSVIRPADRFAACTFLFEVSQPYASIFAADYAALTANVANFPVDAGKSNIYADKVTINRYGGVALLEDNAFPVIVEPSGERLIMEGAGIYNGNPSGARCVVFSHEQFGHAQGDNRMRLFENAILWVSRKSNPADIVLGISTNLDAGYFQSRGYQVRWIDFMANTNLDNPLLGCDAVAVDFHGPATQRFYNRLADFAANGGGIVGTYLPWRTLHGTIKPAFKRINVLLQPFGLAYRSSLIQPTDFGFTNLSSTPYPPILFNGFPSARILREEKMGAIQLSSLEKALAMHAVSYTADRQADRLAALTAIYVGATNSTITAASPGGFTDVFSLLGSQANTNRSGLWVRDGNDLIAYTTLVDDGSANSLGDDGVPISGLETNLASLHQNNARGGVEYDLNVPNADVYRLQLFGTQNNRKRDPDVFHLELTLDGQFLGRFALNAVVGTSGEVDCFTPYILPGSHKLRVFWDNVNVYNQLRLQSVHVQSGNGGDSDGDGIKDWVNALINAQSALDVTNEVIASYASPVCLEGRDPFPELISASVSGQDQEGSILTPARLPNGRWYVNVPLSSAGHAAFLASYQNGAKTETKTLQWLPANVLSGGSYTVRKGDRLRLVGQPNPELTNDAGSVQYSIGTNVLAPETVADHASHPCLFDEPGIKTVSATYTAPNGTTQAGTITVNVVDAATTNLAAWVGMDREWNTSLPQEAELELDDHIFAAPIAQNADGSWRNRLMTDQNIPRYFATRLGTNGSVLSASAVKGFDFWHGADTYTQALQTYPDGSELVEMMLVLHPVLPDITVQMDVIVGGVVFLNGTITKTLTAADFDAQGRCFVRFIRPASAKTSVCHSIRVWQGTTLVGVVL